MSRMKQPKNVSRKAVARRMMQPSNDADYGVCTDCSGKISARRLRAKPEATTCVHCQTERERRWVADPSTGWRSDRNPD